MKTEKYSLTLYIVGQTQKARRAIENITKYCEEHLKDQYIVEVVDLEEHPELAADKQIIAVPTLIKNLPDPIRIFIGDLSDKQKVLVGLNIKQLPGN
jgi:circadian clock protein KaiB